MIYQQQNFFEFQSKHDDAEIIKASNISMFLKDKLAYCYPYGGPPNDKFSYIEFMDDLHKLGVEKYYIRFAPWAENYTYFPQDKIKLSRHTVSVDLTQPIKFGKGTNWSIKQNIKSGAECIFINGCQAMTEVLEFWNAYHIAMDRIESELTYRYSMAYFFGLISKLKDKVEIALIKTPEGFYSAGALFLLDVHKGIVHYFLSGTMKYFQNTYPMERLLSEAISRYKEKGFQLLYLGGGLTDKEDDSLFMFKKKFGDRIDKYHIAEGNIE
jgi:hypothetical protein